MQKGLYLIHAEFYVSVIFEVEAMAGVRDRLPLLYEIRSENRQLLRNNFNDAEKDRQGKYAAALIADLRFFGIAEYVLHRNVEKFQSQLREAAKIREQLFKRIDDGEPIDNSYNSILGYNDILNALAAGDFATAEPLAIRVSQTPVRTDVHKFDEAFGRALCALVSRARNAHSLVDCLQAHCDSRDKDFGGYSEVFSAVLQRNADIANKGLANVILGHKRQSKGKGVFVNTADETLSVWAVAVANLASNRGIKLLSPNEELVPTDLLM